MPKYEYKFVKLDIGWSDPDYEKVIREHANEGWRLTQIFTYNYGWWGVATHLKIIFEREI
ncbi:MAG: DUF4177 domain-containing protein [Candidatus Babeliales bacterium]